jgi:23S rRNA pseudouridine1911/1915/1917 synthase
MDIEILYEDENTWVINKPVGVVVNRADSIRGETIQDWVEERWTDSYEDKVFRQRSGVCHRLDKETSGCLMIARNPEALKYYLKLFKDRKVVKTYLALVHGRVEPGSGETILPLKRSLYDRKKWQVHYEGKRAVTAWSVVKRFTYLGHEHWKDALTLLKLNLKTGRTHQIRVHLSFLGWPIFSDDKYLNRKFSREDRKYLSHHFLHAERIEFDAFGNGKVSVEAPLPVDCEKFLSSLE